jgi:hypothetical protein
VRERRERRAGAGLLHQPRSLKETTMNTFTTKTKMAATIVASLAALTGSALAHGASTREVAANDPNVEVRVVRLGQVLGFWAVNCPIGVANAAAWTQGDSAEATTLQREGFTGGVRELLRSKSGDLGVSVALTFRSAAAAKADLDRREQLAGHAGYATNFAVPGSHSVRAYTVRASGSTTVRVAFTRGATEYGVAVAAAKGTDIGALQRALATAVARVSGR